MNKGAWSKNQTERTLDFGDALDNNGRRYVALYLTIYCSASLPSTLSVPLCITATVPKLPKQHHTKGEIVYIYIYIDLVAVVQVVGSDAVKLVS